MIEGVAEAASLITAYKFSIVSVNGTKKLQIFQNLNKVYKMSSKSKL